MRSRRYGLLGVAALTWLALGSCSPGSRGPERSELTAVPLPAELELLDLPVQQQFRTRHAAVERALADPEVADAHLSRAFGALGMVFHAYDYLDEAGACYVDANLLAPDDVAWIYLLAQVRRVEARWEEERAWLERVLELDPDHVPTLIWLAEEAVESAEIERAERLYRRALEADSTCAAAMLGRGRIALARDEHQQAVEHLEEALAWQPSAAAVHYALGTAYRALGDLARAQEHLDRVPASNVFQDRIAVADSLMGEVMNLRVGSRSHDSRAMRALTRGNPALAAIEFRQALATDPDRIYARYGLALALRKLGRRREAIVELRELVGLAPNHRPSRLLLAELLSAEDRSGEAEEHLRAVLDFDPDSAAAHLGLANLLRDSGRAEPALAHYARARELDPGLEAAHFEHAVTLIGARRDAEAVQVLAGGRRDLPASQPLTLLAARLLAAAPEAAVRDGESALELAREAAAAGATVTVAETVAMAYAELGELAGAIAWQRAAVAVVEPGAESSHRVRRRLALYESGSACREPWAAGETLDSRRIQPPPE
ncbi:MAG: tetratricopeptide repeat protein [bacterium]|nr:tetratricopeptide repeat protein [bacterium]